MTHKARHATSKVSECLHFQVNCCATSAVVAVIEAMFDALFAFRFYIDGTPGSQDDASHPRAWVARWWVQAAVPSLCILFPKAAVNRLLSNHSPQKDFGIRPAKTQEYNALMAHVQMNWTVEKMATTLTSLLGVQSSIDPCPAGENFAACLLMFLLSLSL